MDAAPQTRFTLFGSGLSSGDGNRVDFSSIVHPVRPTASRVIFSESRLLDAPKVRSHLAQAMLAQATVAQSFLTQAILVEAFVAQQGRSYVSR